MIPTDLNRAHVTLLTGSPQSPLTREASGSQPRVNLQQLGFKVMVKLKLTGTQNSKCLGTTQQAEDSRRCVPHSQALGPYR